MLQENESKICHKKEKVSHKFLKCKKDLNLSMWIKVRKSRKKYGNQGSIKVYNMS